MRNHDPYSDCKCGDSAGRYGRLLSEVCSKPASLPPRGLARGRPPALPLSACATRSAAGMAAGGLRLPGTRRGVCATADEGAPADEKAPIAPGMEVGAGAETRPSAVLDGEPDGVSAEDAEVEPPGVCAVAASLVELEDDVPKAPLKV